jgi:hypothetical protein
MYRMMCWWWYGMRRSRSTKKRGCKEQREEGQRDARFYSKGKVEEAH